MGWTERGKELKAGGVGNFIGGESEKGWCRARGGRKKKENRTWKRSSSDIGGGWVALMSAEWS